MVLELQATKDFRKNLKKIENPRKVIFSNPIQMKHPRVFHEKMDSCLIAIFRGPGL